MNDKVAIKTLNGHLLVDTEAREAIQQMSESASEEFERLEEFAGEVQEKLNELEGANVQPDWDQNDPTAADYVKNRTHYTEVVEKPLETVAPFTFTVDTDDEWSGCAVTYVGTESKRIAPFPMGLVYKDGYINTDEVTNYMATQIIVFDGVEYECAPTKIYQGYTGYIYGNLALYQSGRDDTGEPFCWMYFPKDVVDRQYAYNVVYFVTAETAETAVEHTIAAYSPTETVEAETVHTIDLKYLPAELDEALTYLSQSLDEVMAGIGDSPTLTSPGGTKYKLTVDDDGNLTTSEVTDA